MKTLLTILLNVMGIVICFLTKYNNRRQKDKTFSIAYWWKDNWPELAITVLFDLAVMILVMAGDIKIDIARFLPEWILGVGTLTISFLLGLGLAALIYEVFKKKVKEIKG